jgi:hypothetical protein
MQPSLLQESWPEHAPTWPRSGTWDLGAAYEQPTSAPPTAEPESSSLLPTPDAYQAARGGSQDPEKRIAGGHAVSLQDVTEHQLLPTPRVSMHHGPSESEIEAGDPFGRIETAVEVLHRASLLPTPRATDGTKGGPNQRGSSGDLMLLPTPAVNDMGEGKTAEWWDDWTEASKAKHGNGNGHGKSLAIEAQRLLPTPRAQHSEERNQNIWARPLDQPQNLENALARLPGESTNPPSDDGNESLAARHPPPPRPACEARNASHPASLNG